MFTINSQIWTVYLEVVLPKGEDNTFVVIQVWSNVIKQISSIPMLETVSNLVCVCVCV